MEAHGFCMMIRNRYTFQKVLEKYMRGFPEETVLIYSMWQGYLDNPNSPYKKLMEGFQHIEFLHTSGHATRAAIEKVCQVVKPKQGIIPIHSGAPQKLDELKIGRIIRLEDGEEYNLLQKNLLVR